MADRTEVETTPGNAYGIRSVRFLSQDSYQFHGRTHLAATTLYTTDDGATVRWASPLYPPAVGTEVAIIMNRLGKGKVISYFREFGWLGVTVQLDEPPAWHRKQRPNGVAMVFSSELKDYPLTEEAPRPEQELRCKSCGRKLEIGQHCTHVQAVAKEVK